MGNTRIVLHLARKFLASKKSESFISLIAWVSVMGVSLGVLALIVVTSVINGFEGELSRAITGMNGDIILYSRGNPIDHPDELAKKIKSLIPDVVASTPNFTTELMVSGPKGVGGAVLEGIDSSTLGEVTEIPRRITDGRLPVAKIAREKNSRVEVTLGFHLAEKVGAKVGDDVRLIAPFAGETHESRYVQAKVVGIFKVGMYRYDSKFMLAALKDVQDFLEAKGAVTTFKIKMPPGKYSGKELEKISNQLSESFGYPFRAKYWGQLDKNLLYAIELEKIVIALILTAILIVAAFNVVSTLMMMVYDKTKELAILKAMGLSPAQSFQLFCGIGMLIGSLGVGIGLGLGVLVNKALAKTQWIKLPDDVYNIGYLPVVERWSEISLIVIFGLLICFAATLFPAISVMRRSPLEGIRNE